MKRSIKALLALALLLSVGVLPALASENPTGSQEIRIDNSQAGNNPTEDQTIDVQGRLGFQDNTLPGYYPPADDPFWINIALPTFVFFHTTPDSDGVHGLALDSPEYFIRNYSHHAIEITVDGFAGKTAADDDIAEDYIYDLALVTDDGEDVVLMSSQAFVTLDDEEFLTIDGNVSGNVRNAAGEIITPAVPSVVSFEFDGVLDELPTQPNTNPTFDLTFNFQSVHRDPAYRD